MPPPELDGVDLGMLADGDDCTYVAAISAAAATECADAKLPLGRWTDSGVYVFLGMAQELGLTIAVGGPDTDGDYADGAWELASRLLRLWRELGNGRTDADWRTSPVIDGTILLAPAWRWASS